MNMHKRVALLALLSFIILHPSTSLVAQQIPGLINYQGRLLDGTNLVNGEVGLSLRLFPQPTEGFAFYEDSNTVTVTDGLYSTFLGDDTTSGSLDLIYQEYIPVYIETVVNGVALSPRERVASVMFALLASNVVSGAITPAQLNLSTFDTTFWKVDGNAGTYTGQHFVGTTDDVPLEFKVNGTRALRLQPSLSVPSVIGGSDQNNSSPLAVGATIGGGSRHDIGDYAAWAVVGGGYANTIESNNNSAVIGGGGANAIRTMSGYVTIGGGYSNEIRDLSTYATIAGGTANEVGKFNTYATISGGSSNTIYDDSRGVVIAGGTRNLIGQFSYHASIGGGLFNSIGDRSYYSHIGGGQTNTVGDDAHVSTIGGGTYNSVGDSAEGATIAGGQNNDILTSANHATIGGGLDNRIVVSSTHATISGGRKNEIGAFSDYAVIGGGRSNELAVFAAYATIGGGRENHVAESAEYAVIGGGLNNNAGGIGSTVPGGQDNDAANTLSFAAGNRAKAVHVGSFVWGDASNEDIVSSNENSVTMRAVGGFRLLTATSLGAGAELVSGSGSWTSLSDVNAKKNFTPVDGREILAAIEALPIHEWSYKSQPDSVRHIGPTAQDFHQAFGVGDKPTGITTVDADGVALAAIQALAKENAGLKEQVSGLEQENHALQERLKALERKLGM